MGSKPITWSILKGFGHEKKSKELFQTFGSPNFDYPLEIEYSLRFAKIGELVIYWVDNDQEPLYIEAPVRFTPAPVAGTYYISTSRQEISIPSHNVNRLILNKT